MLSRSLYLGLTCFALLLAGLLLTSAAHAAPPEVVVSQPLVREVADYEDFDGRSEPLESVEIRTRVLGLIDKVHFEEGATVKKGDLLFTLDPRPYRAVAEVAEADAKLAEARLKLAETTLQRMKKLAETGTVSREELDKAAAERVDAEAALTVAKVKVDAARIDLEATRIMAPISGRIGRTLLTAGNYVQAGATPLARIVSLDPLGVAFDVDERSYLRLQRQLREGKLKAKKETELPVVVRFQDEAPRQARLDFVDNRVDPSNGTLRMRAVFANADGLLLPGMFARVRLTTSEPYRALLVPEPAVGKDKGKAYLLVVSEQNIVEKRPVTLGSAHDGLRAVNEGLKEEEWVVVAGPTEVRPGMAVKPKRIPVGPAVP
jgi:multidrug efflux system membrane fusion protein